MVESRTANRMTSQLYIELSDGLEQSVKIQVMNFSNAGIFKVDTEADQVYQVSVQNTLATVIQREGSIQLTWMYPESNCIVMLYGDNISTETALRIAQSIVLS